MMMMSMKFMPMTMGKVNSLSFLFVVSVLSNGFVISDNLTPRGVPLSRAALYDPQKDFSCLDGSKLIPFSMVNDDYCDCPDGSDEPGTSACSRGSFFCHNAGYVSGYIPSSRVNDHICDCCDGTDETGTVQCPNTCDELGRAAREESERMATLLKEGYQKRVELANAGKEFRKSKDEEKAKLESERQRLEAIKQEKEKIKEDAEAPEKEALDRYREIEEAKQKKLDEEENAKNALEAENMFTMLDSNGDGKLTVDEIKTRQTFDKNKDGEVSEEEALFFLNMEQEMSKEDFLSTGWSMAKPFFLMEQGMFQPPEEEGHVEVGERDTATEALAGGGAPVTQEPPLKELTEEEIQTAAEREERQEKETIPGVEDEDEDEEELYDEDGHDTHATSSEVDNKVEPQPVESKYDDATQALIDAAEKARSEFNEADRNVRDVVKQLEELNEIVNLDFGEDERFAPLHGQCFDFEDREYVYTLCPFKSATQKPRNGGSEVSLGKWGSWTGPEENKFAEMLYDKGQSCWNGPNRSARVHLTCGTENRLTGVSEPSRCEYHYDFTSPATCSQPIHNHDEL